MAGSVWGTDMYTDDSSVCAAAQHAGKVGPAGGEVTVFAASGQPVRRNERDPDDRSLSPRTPKSQLMNHQSGRMR